MNEQTQNTGAASVAEQRGATVHEFRPRFYIIDVDECGTCGEDLTTTPEDEPHTCPDVTLAHIGELASFLRRFVEMKAGAGECTRDEARAMLYARPLAETLTYVLTSRVASLLRRAADVIADQRTELDGEACANPIEAELENTAETLTKGDGRQ